MSELSARQLRALEAAGCDLRVDALTRTLYATDASIYRVEPAAVAMPSGCEETARLLAAAADAG
ncbi:MAG TPA: hypothetical protein VLT32_08480, partial [Candidatus Sulfomarinibacteraceae bacterium]|nr:hypothetical protein [Candidatus Sulfomarinibacteraceae bacterium]